MAVTHFTGIYNADGGLLGEARYVIGHLLGTAECALCDITHSPIRRKPEWDRMVADLGVAVMLLHRNELDDTLRAAIADHELPLVLGHDGDALRVVLSAAQLTDLAGSVTAVGAALKSEL